MNLNHHSSRTTLFVFTLSVIFVPIYCSDCTFILKAKTNVTYIDVPTAKKPVSAWLNVQKGIFPNISPIFSSLQVGEPITISVYFRDDTLKYDAVVKECWASDIEDYEIAKHKLKITNNPKLVSTWKKVRFPFMKNVTLLHAHLLAFKFPEKREIFLTCDVQICFGTCKTQQKKDDDNDDQKT